MTESFGQLRVLNEADLNMVLLWRNHPNIRDKMYTSHEISEAEHSAWWSRVSTSSKEQYFIYEKASLPLGVVAFTQIDQISKNASWAFYAASDAPKGTGTAMEFLALEYAFNNLRLNKLWCEVLSFNQNVLKLHKKFGFVEEGCFIEQHYHEQYKLVNIHRLALFNKTWQDYRVPLLEKLSKYK